MRAAREMRVGVLKVCENGITDVFGISDLFKALLFGCIGRTIVNLLIASVDLTVGSSEPCCAARDASRQNVVGHATAERTRSVAADGSQVVLPWKRVALL